MGAFDGGAMTSDGGALLLGATDKAIRLIERFAACFSDARAPELIEHSLDTLVGQRVFGLALGYEDLVDHDLLRHDPVMATLIGKLQARREDCAPLAGKSTLNRLEQSLRGGVGRYHKIGHDTEAIEALFVTLFLEAHQRPSQPIVLDLDATDDPLHGHQEGRFFHGYYDTYCYLPLYIFCGRHLLAAKLRRANIDAAHGARKEVERIVKQIASFAYVLLCALRRIALAGTDLAAATCGTIRLRLLKIGALVTRSVRRIKIAFASACPTQAIFAIAAHRLRRAAA